MPGSHLRIDRDWFPEGNEEVSSSCRYLGGAAGQCQSTNGACVPRVLSTDHLPHRVQIDQPRAAPVPQDDPGIDGLARKRRQGPFRHQRQLNERAPDLASHRRRSSCSSQVASPLLHQHPATLEQVGPAIGRLHPIRIHVRQGELADLAGRIRALGRRVPERRAEAVRHSNDDLVVPTTNSQEWSNLFPGLDAGGSRSHSGPVVRLVRRSDARRESKRSHPQCRAGVGGARSTRSRRLAKLGCPTPSGNCSEEPAQ